MTDVWGDLNSLADEELQLLTAAAMHVLETGGDGGARDASRMPEQALTREVREALAAEGIDTDTGDAERIVTDEAVSRPVAIALLSELATEPELKSEIERAYEARRDMMVVDGGLILGGALLLLVLKLKRVKIGDNEVEFYEAKEGALAQIRGFLGL